MLGPSAPPRTAPSRQIAPQSPAGQWTIFSSIPSIRVRPFLTSSGPKPPSRSRGTAAARRLCLPAPSAMIHCGGRVYWRRPGPLHDPDAPSALLRASVHEPDLQLLHQPGIASRSSGSSSPSEVLPKFPRKSSSSCSLSGDTDQTPVTHNIRHSHLVPRKGSARIRRAPLHARRRQLVQRQIRTARRSLYF